MQNFLCALYLLSPCLYVEAYYTSIFNMMQFRDKRIMEGSLFDVHRAEPSQQLMVATPPLDMKRAESSQQHVRALNTQFARFIFYSMSTNLPFLDFCTSNFPVNEKKFGLDNWIWFIVLFLGLAYSLVVVSCVTFHTI